MKKRVAYSYNCGGCKKKEEFDQFQVNMYYMKRKALPRGLCKSCKDKKFNRAPKDPIITIKNLVLVPQKTHTSPNFEDNPALKYLNKSFV